MSTTEPTVIEKLEVILSKYDASVPVELSNSLDGKTEIALFLNSSTYEFAGVDNVIAMEPLLFDHKFMSGLFGTDEVCRTCGKVARDTRSYPSGGFTCDDCGKTKTMPRFAFHLIELALISGFDDRVGYIYYSLFPKVEA